MAIKKHDSQKRIQAVNSIKSNLEKCLNVQHVPEVIKQQIIALQNEISSIDFTTLSEPALEINGPVATQEEVLSIIKEESDCTKWKNQEGVWDESEHKERLEWIKEAYNVTFDETKTKSYFISRDIRGRDSVSVIEVVTLPGYFQVSYQASSVGWSEEKLLTLKEFKSAIYSTVE